MGFCKRKKHSFLSLTSLFWGWMLIPFMNLKPLILAEKWKYNLMPYKLRWETLEKLINRKHCLTRIQLEAVCQIYHNSDQDIVSNQPLSTMTHKGNIFLENYCSKQQKCILKLSLPFPGIVAAFLCQSLLLIIIKRNAHCSTAEVPRNFWVLPFEMMESQAAGLLVLGSILRDTTFPEELAISCRDISMHYF